MEMDEIRKKVLEDVDPTTKKQVQAQRRKRNIRTAIEFLVLVVMILLAFQFIWGISLVKGDSMYPTLHNRDAVLYQRVGSDYAVGDVVIIKRPENKTYVKRIVAVAGDVVNIEGGILFVNGKEQEFESDFGKTVLESGDVEYPLTVKENEIFVLGDNREISEDSRAFGAVKTSSVKGTLIFYFGRVR